eukprot:scaffold28081_cov36-Prasinocladus_malaysianus.AAC.1
MAARALRTLALRARAASGRLAQLPRIRSAQVPRYRLICSHVAAASPWLPLRISVAAVPHLYQRPRFKLVARAATEVKQQPADPRNGTDEGEFASELVSHSSTVVLLDVEGMKCGGCSAAVKRILQEQPGVQGASVNLLTKIAALQ